MQRHFAQLANATALALEDASPAALAAAASGLLAPGES
jgi:hypothetical protein